MVVEVLAAAVAVATTLTTLVTVGLRVAVVVTVVDGVGMPRQRHAVEICASTYLESLGGLGHRRGALRFPAGALPFPLPLPLPLPAVQVVIVFVLGRCEHVPAVCLGSL